jgi:hypothetical protein
MKLSSTLLLLASVVAPAFADISDPHVAAKLLRSARRLEEVQEQQQEQEAEQQQQQQQEAENEWYNSAEYQNQQFNERFGQARMEGQVWPQGVDLETDFNFLWKYSLKMIHCNAGSPVLRENGEYDYNSVVLRLCPNDNGGCNSNKQMGCTKGHGDFVVSLETYMSYYFEEKERYQYASMSEQELEEYNNGNAADAFATCNEYDRNNDNQEQQADNYSHGYQISQDARFFVGPTCTRDGTDIRLALFTDEFCSQESTIPFRAISNGNRLPFSTGGMISHKCMTCKELTNGNDIYSSREFCRDVYSASAASCEKKMETTSRYGAITTGCDYIYDLLPHSYLAPPKLTSDAIRAMAWTAIAVVGLALLGWLSTCCMSKPVIPYPEESGVLTTSPSKAPILEKEDSDEDLVKIDKPDSEAEGEQKKGGYFPWVKL